MEVVDTINHLNWIYIRMISLGESEESFFMRKLKLIIEELAASRVAPMLSDVQELCKKTIDSQRKLSEFGGGGHYGHNVACNYQREYEGKTFCNCGVSDLIYAAKLAEKIKEHIG